MRLYGRHLANTLLLRHGCIHAEVLEDVQRFRDNGYSASKAAKLAIGKNKHILKSKLIRLFLSRKKKIAIEVGNVKIDVISIFKGEVSRVVFVNSSCCCAGF